MKTLLNILKKIYILSTGYSYTHLGRMFLRMFVGVMLMQFAVRQWMDFDTALGMTPGVLGMSPTATLVLMIIIGIFCSLCIMVGFCTRIMTIPPFIAMVIAEAYVLSQVGQAPYTLTWIQPGYVPMMFLGIYFFILLVGPGKISFDYFLSLHLIQADDLSEEEELEEV